MKNLVTEIPSVVTAISSTQIINFLEADDRGVVLGEAGMLRLAPGLVRIPDVSFISWDKIPGGEFPEEPIPELVPDLAVEVLSKGNTRPEMELKVREYFDAGARLVWLIDGKRRTVDVYTSRTEFRHYGNGQTLHGGSVLPGFRLNLRQFFSRARRRKSKTVRDGTA